MDKKEGVLLVGERNRGGTHQSTGCWTRKDKKLPCKKKKKIASERLIQAL
jgi:hypothetical protein